MIIRKSQREIDFMKQAGRIVAEAFKLLENLIEPGITTKELNDKVEEFIRRSGGTPAFKGYRGFPAAICTSINEVVVHGIPGARQLEEGDILSIDIGVVYKNYFGDAAVTFPVGEISDEAGRLLEVTKRALMKGIDQTRSGKHLSDISHAVQRTAESKGYSVVRDFVGHGIGRSMHEDPQIPNYGPPGRGPLLSDGMALAIEPMVNIGGSEVEVLSDNWAVVTADGNLSAHFEHTVVIVDGEPVILTSL